MHQLYNFDFLNTISLQLKELLDQIKLSHLSDDTLGDLKNFQKENRSKQGVYLLFYEGAPVYLGKADNVALRLEEHLEKLRGRKNISSNKIGYKAILLDTSMSTAANEKILIALFGKQHKGMWNGKGFGPKDPGKQRDNTKPGEFDARYPINEEYIINFGATSGKLGVFLQTAKTQLPYTFRFEITAGKLEQQVLLPDMDCSAEVFLQCVVDCLGKGWKGVILNYGMIIYKTDANFDFGKVVFPRYGV